MKCMRCGTAITSKAVFCEKCLEDMKRHPVDPSTPIQLPQRQEAPPAKNHYKKTRKPEEIVSLQRGVILWLVLIILALALSLGMVLSMLIPVLDQPAQTEPAAAYTTVEEHCFT